MKLTSFGSPTRELLEDDRSSIKSLSQSDNSFRDGLGNLPIDMTTFAISMRAKTFVQVPRLTHGLFRPCPNSIARSQIAIASRSWSLSVLLRLANLPVRYSRKFQR